VTWDRQLYFPSGGGLLRPKSPTTSARFEPANLGTRGQQANHKTTEAAPQCTVTITTKTESSVDIFKKRLYGKQSDFKVFSLKILVLKFLNYTIDIFF
jgi:hypothetical protein